MGSGRYNLISKSTEGQIWVRHIVDSAQLVKFIEKKTLQYRFWLRAGFPGLILAIYFENKGFHVKLVEKSPIKRTFLEEISKKLKLKVQILDNVYLSDVSADIIVCGRAFKKLGKLLKFHVKLLKNHMK